jgi:hypothetical protein
MLLNIGKNVSNLISFTVLSIYKQNGHLLWLPLVISYVNNLTVLQYSNGVIARILVNIVYHQSLKVCNFDLHP